MKKIFYRRIIHGAREIEINFHAEWQKNCH